ncbi:carbamoyltransferase HypF [Streptomyces sp. NPDC060275]|uniref:carbamoyltransferase HypF n=1 Tax=Streptomyces sp. NPDC060275 TaxID=3347090 RepID=UPI00364AC37D
MADDGGTSGAEVWVVRVTGVVQGVGYRPFVHRLAVAAGLSGWVLNDTPGVLTEVCGPQENLRAFVAALADRAPPLAHVAATEIQRRRPVSDVQARARTGFRIRDSRRVAGAGAMAPPDAHVCADCLGEVFDQDDRRYRYPFTNCTNCGPRYSLIHSLPYDRQRTTMAAFMMCEACAAEYADPNDRRYHAQPNACWDCGPRLSLHRADAPDVQRDDDALRGAAEGLAAGCILAVKGVGGYHLMVNARDSEAVTRLRLRKKRPSKPFAVLVADAATAARLVHYGPDERQLLESPARPIVLLRKRTAAHQEPLPEIVAPRLPSLGVMLPCTPLHHLLLADGPSGVPFDALVMTSGNATGRPTVFRAEDAHDQLGGIADLFLCHDRDIETQVDDSVLWCTRHPELAEPVVSMLRRARGHTPGHVAVSSANAPDGSVVGYGAQMKATVAVGDDRRILVGQHLGDLDDEAALRACRASAARLSALTGVRPRYAARDLNSSYGSSVVAESAGATEIVPVQHHHAHMAACMGENRLTGRTLGVVFDGTGLGEDGSTRGAEFLLGDAAEVRRVAWLRPVRLAGGDKAIREPVRTALALALDALPPRQPKPGTDESGGISGFARAAFPALAALDGPDGQVVELMIRRGLNSPSASSMGRLFDGVAALIGLCPYTEYEAQAPAELEALLERDLAQAEPYPFGVVPYPHGVEVDPRPLVRRIAGDLAAGIASPLISRRFHSGVVAMVVERCEAERLASGTRQVVLSGGVFHNEFLTVNCLVALRRAGFEAYAHRLLPCGDGGISLGQVMVASARLRERAGTRAADPPPPQHSLGTPSA